MKRKSKAKSVAVNRIDAGTPETRAKLQQPPWHGWPSELMHAAIEIDLAVRLTVGHAAQAMDLEGWKADHSARDRPLTAREKAILRKYKAWGTEMNVRKWLVGPILETVIHGGMPRDINRLKLSLQLYVAVGRN